MELGYWDIKGQAQPIRWLIKYIGLNIKEYNPKNREEWNKKKEEIRLEFPFPKLPYFYDSIKKEYVTEAKAVFAKIAYLANKPEMTGKCERDKIQVEMVYGIISEVKAFYLEKFNQTSIQVSDMFEDDCNAFLMAKLHGLSRYLGDKDYFMVYLTILDFEAAYLYDLFEILCEKCELNHPWSAFPNLMDHKDRVKNLVGVKQFIEDEKEENMDFFKEGQVLWFTD